MQDKQKKRLSREEIMQMAQAAVHDGKHGNHAAFANAFLSLICTRKKLFEEKILSLFSGPSPEAEGRRAVLSRDKDLQIMKPETWRDEKVSYDTAPPKGFYSKKYVTEVLRGDTRHSRELLLQLSICMGLSVEEANDFLLSDGEPMLYILRPGDAVTMFYLQKFREEEKNGCRHLPSEKLRIVKASLNRILSLRDGAGGEVRDSLGFPKKLSLSIAKEMEELKKQYENREDIRNAIDDKGDFGSTTYYPTRLFQELLLPEKTFSEFMDFGKMEDGKLIFAEKCYGFLRKSLQYVEAADRYAKYQRPSMEKLVIQRDFSLSENQRKASPTREKTLNGKIREVDRIMSMRLNGEGVELPQKDTGSWSTTVHLLNGREIKITMGDVKKNIYLFEQMPKTVLMQYAVATGNEEDLGEYLRLSGYWTVDWTRWVEMGGECPDPHAVLDRTDYLYLYAFACRRQYLDAWKEEARKQGRFEKSTIMAELRREFPMAVLLLLVEDAILREFVNQKERTAEERSKFARETLIFLRDGEIR